MNGNTCGPNNKIYISSKRALGKREVFAYDRITYWQAGLPKEMFTNNNRLDKSREAKADFYAEDG